MPLNYPNDGLSDGLFGNMRWLFELQERLEATTKPFDKLHKQLDFLMRPNSLMAFAARNSWPDNSLLAASQKLAKLAHSPKLPESVLPGVAGFDRINALAAGLPPTMVRQAVGVEGI